MNKVVTWSVIILILAAGAWLFTSSKQETDCREKAVENSVSAYPLDSYPDVNERARLQQQYEAQYIADYCQ